VSGSIGHLCSEVMLKIALIQQDPSERSAMLQIMRDDGALSSADFARLTETQEAA